jgi:hypothetical protein
MNEFATLIEKTGFYAMLANYYEYINRELHAYYAQRHYACLLELIEYVRSHGDPYENLESSKGMPSASPAEAYAYPKMRLAPANVRIFHASPDAPSVDIYANERQLADNLSYNELTKYISIPAGQYKTDVYPAGQKWKPALSKMVTIHPGTSYTLTAAGQLVNLDLLTIVDDPDISVGRAKLRFLHLSSDAPRVDIAVRGGNVIFPNVSFRQITPYLAVEPQTVDLEVRLAGFSQMIMMISNVSLMPDQIYSIAAVGLVKGGPPGLEALILAF